MATCLPCKYSIQVNSYCYPLVLSCVRFFATSVDCRLPGSSCPWNFSGKNTGVGCHFPPPRDLPDPGTETATPTSAGGFFITSTTWGSEVTRCRERKSGSSGRGCSLRRYFFSFKLSCHSGIKLIGGWLTFYWHFVLALSPYHRETITGEGRGRGFSSDTNCKGVAHCWREERRRRARCFSQLGLL